ncbi:LysE family transporter [Alicyclobacillus contaminans]|uniref:LysE family transporter n=1 Tax=Alicyclobacillus contaminans TaxID=392016 RepID=UPI001FE03056|nr:LysE family transporter [Alicyclobacillus contaminans]
MIVPLVRVLTSTQIVFLEHVLLALFALPVVWRSRGGVTAEGVCGKEVAVLMMELFGSGFLLSLSLCLDLGIVNVAVLKTGIERGVVPSFLLGLGSSFGDLVYAGLSMVGMSLLLRFAVVRWLLWIGGTLALGYLSVHMIRESLRPKALVLNEAGTAIESSWIRPLLTGVGLALSSPSAILWFAAVGGSVIAATTRTGALGGSSLVFFLGFFTAGVLWSAVVAFVSGQARRWLGTSLLRGVSLLSAALFVYFACRVFLNGLHTLV